MRSTMTVSIPEDVRKELDRCRVSRRMALASRLNGTGGRAASGREPEVQLLAEMTGVST